MKGQLVGGERGDFWGALKAALGVVGLWFGGVRGLSWGGNWRYLFVILGWTCQGDGFTLFVGLVFFFFQMGGISSLGIWMRYYHT